MHREPRWRRYLRFWRRDVSSDVDDELRFHFENRVAEYRAAGAAAEDAVARARVQFGDLDAVRANLVDIDRHTARRHDTLLWVQSLGDDLRHVMRSIIRRPLVPAMVAAMMALAVGATATVFAALDPVFFRQPAGVTDPSSLRRLFNLQPRMAALMSVRPVSALFDYPAFLTIRDATHGLARMAVDWAPDSVDVEHDGRIEHTGVAFTTSDFLPMLGVRIERGRTFSAADDDVNNPAMVAVMSHAFAARLLGDSTDPLGAQISFRGHTYRVIGVTAPGFAGLGLSETSIWVPLSTRVFGEATEREPWYRRGDIYLPIIVRLLPGTDVDALVARATTAYRRAYNPPPPAMIDASILTAPLAPGRGPQSATHEEEILTCVAAVAVLLWVIACANVANLLLVRAIARRREIGVRVALGISRRRLASLIGLEALVLAALAGVASLVLSRWSGDILRTQLMPRVHWPDAVLNVRLIVFTGIASLVAALVAGAAPAWIVSHYGISDALKAGARDGSANRPRLRTAMLCVQAGLATVLIAGAVLFGESLHNVRGVDLGYDSDRIVIGSVYFRDEVKHPELDRVMPLIAAQIAALPTVDAAAPSGGAPMNSWSGVWAWRPGADSAHPIASMPNYIGVAPEYFHITGTRVLEGRSFTRADDKNAPRVMVVSATMAKQLWPGQRAIGQCIELGSPSGPCYTVIGVAEDAHEFRIVNKETESQFYVPLDQQPYPRSPATIIARANGPSADAVAATLGRTLRERFPNAEIRAIPLARAIEPELRPWVLGARLLAGLSAVALIVAMLGVYAMIAFDAGQRMREIGIRLALGATRASLIELLVRRGVVAVTIGVVIGAAIALAAGRLVQSMLFGITASDPRAIVGAAAVLFAAAMAASVVPAIRASTINTTAVLREE